MQNSIFACGRISGPHVKILSFFSILLSLSLLTTSKIFTHLSPSPDILPSSLNSLLSSPPPNPCGQQHVATPTRKPTVVCGGGRTARVRRRIRRRHPRVRLWLRVDGRWWWAADPAAPLSAGQWGGGRIRRPSMRLWPRRRRAARVTDLAAAAPPMRRCGSGASDSNGGSSGGVLGRR